MEKQIVVGICTFAGTDICRILNAIKRNVIDPIPFVTYSLENSASLELITEEILRKKKASINIIHSISSVEQMIALEKIFQHHTFQIIGIQWAWEECFAFLEARKLTVPGETKLMWRNRFADTDEQKQALKCFEKIKSESESWYKLDSGCFNERIGEIVDVMLRLV